MRFIFLEPMLEDSSQFGLSNVEGTHLQSTMNTIATFPKLIAVVLGGILLDLLGRRVLMSCNLFIAGLIFVYIPHAAPSYRMLYLAIIMNDIFLSVLEANPLNIDYAAK